MLLFAVVTERLNPFHAHSSDPNNKLVSSGCRNPFSRSRWIFGKSLLTSIRAVCPVLMALESLLSTVPFCWDVYAAVSLRRIPTLLQKSVNVMFVHSVPLSFRTAHGMHILVSVQALEAEIAVHNHDDVMRAPQ